MPIRSEQVDPWRPRTQKRGFRNLLEPYEGKNYVDRADFRLQMKNPDLDAAIEDYRQAIDLRTGQCPILLPDGTGLSEE